jgi:hypothetical protein
MKLLGLPFTGQAIFIRPMQFSSLSLGCLALIPSPYFPVMLPEIRYAHTSTSVVSSVVQARNKKGRSPSGAPAF